MGEKIRDENHHQQQKSLSQSQNNVLENFSEYDTDNNVPKFEISQLKVFSIVGRGAKGVVFHARIENSDEDLALKVVLKSSMKKSRSITHSIEFEQTRVYFEQQVLRELNHPLLPRLRGVFETNNVFGYAIDYCSGGNLSLVRKQQVEKMFSDDIIRFYGAEMVLALEYLHQKGIVYRDLKPENVVIQNNGHLMLVDFDLSTKLVPKSPQTQPSLNSVKKPQLERKKSQLSKFYTFCNSGISAEDSVNSDNNSVNSVDASESDSVGKSNSFVGTEEYVAPEIIQGNGHDFAVDWWSFGVVLHEMLYGTTPFRGENRKQTFYRILYKTPELVGETTPLRDLIKKLLEKDPKKRISLEGIKSHAFFKGVDWEMIVRLPRPPFIPGRSDMDDGVDDVIDVESIVYGVFKMEEVHNNNNNNNNNNMNDNCGKDSVNKTKISIDKESRGVWMDALEQPAVSNNFLVF